MPPLQVIAVMDPGQDLDDEMFMVLSAVATVLSQDQAHRHRDLLRAVPAYAPVWVRMTRFNQPC